MLDTKPETSDVALSFLAEIGGVALISETEIKNLPGHNPNHTL